MLNTRSIIIGIVGSLAMLAILGVSRLFSLEVEVAELKVREVELALPTPPPPPPEEQPPPDLPPPPPTLTQISALPDPSRVPVPKADLPMDIKAPVENFFTDLAPPPLPTPPEPTPPQRPVRPPTPPSHYQAKELDGIPQLLSHGSAVFPNALSRRGVNRGTVVLEVEISTKGKVSIRRVVSSTHEELISAARKVAAGARFSAPKRKGRVVKAIMRWPITIEK